MAKGELEGSELVYFATLALEGALYDLSRARAKLLVSGRRSPTLDEEACRIRVAYENLCRVNGTEVRK